MKPQSRAAHASEPASRSVDPASPCVSICVIDDARGLCHGCHRTLDEIARWSGYSPAEKLAVLEKVARRKTAAAGNSDSSL